MLRLLFTAVPLFVGSIIVTRESQLSLYLHLIFDKNIKTLRHNSSEIHPTGLEIYHRLHKSKTFMIRPVPWSQEIVKIH